MLCWILIVLAHWNNSPWIYMLLHSNTLSWFWAKQTLLLLLNDECLAEKKQIPIVVFAFTQPGLTAMIYHTGSEYTNHYTMMHFQCLKQIMYEEVIKFFLNSWKYFHLWMLSYILFTTKYDTSGSCCVWSICLRSHGCHGNSLLWQTAGSEALST